MEILSLNKNHDRTHFDCGEELLNEYIKKYASQHAKSGLAKTFVGVNDKVGHQRVIGFYSICVGTISFEEIPAPLKLPRYPILIIRIARLAVDISMQKKGIGEALLMDALYRSVNVSNELAVLGVVVDAKHDKAKSFYIKYGFQELTNKPLSLILTIEQIKKSII